MTAATKIERSGLAIRATLAELAPAECTEFEAEFRQALAYADADFDLGHVDAVLDRWWGSLRCAVRWLEIAIEYYDTAARRDPAAAADLATTGDGVVRVAVHWDDGSSSGADARSP